MHERVINQPLNGKAHGDLGKALYRLNIREFGFCQLKKAVLLHHEDPDVFFFLCNIIYIYIYIYIADLFEERGDITERENCLIEVVKLNGEHLEGLIKLSEIYLQKHEYEKSIALLEKAKDIDLHNEEIYNNLGLCYLNMVNIIYIYIIYL